VTQLPPRAPGDRRELTPLLWSNINPYGTFRLDMDCRLALDHVPIKGHPAITE
jgi:hypothetical protein